MSISYFLIREEIMKKKKIPTPHMDKITKYLKIAFVLLIFVVVLLSERNEQRYAPPPPAEGTEETVESVFDDKEVSKNDTPIIEENKSLDTTLNENSATQSSHTPPNIEYNEILEPYLILGDRPLFSEEEINSLNGPSWQEFSELDNFNRVGQVNALLGLDIKPDENTERGSISNVYPTGWQQKQYDIVSAKYLYNRSHLIGWQLSGEDANWLNLITGTRQFNVEGMLPIENLVADYIETTGNQVRYRVTPDFRGEELLARGVFMEACSIVDNCGEVSIYAYVFNAQEGIDIDYSTGHSRLLN